jgi:hypothetical protein
MHNIHTPRAAALPVNTHRRCDVIRPNLSSAVAAGLNHPARLRATAAASERSPGAPSPSGLGGNQDGLLTLSQLALGGPSPAVSFEPGLYGLPGVTRPDDLLEAASSLVLVCGELQAQVARESVSGEGK